MFAWCRPIARTYLLADRLDCNLSASFSLINQARKKSTKIKFLGPETARRGGGLPREGVVAEKFVPSLETLSSLGFEERNPGCPGNFAGMSRTSGGVQKVCAKKVRAHFSFPNKESAMQLQENVERLLETNMGMPLKWEKGLSKLLGGFGLSGTES